MLEPRRDLGVGWHLLGPVRLVAGGKELDPGPEKQCLLAAVLLLTPGHSVTTASLVQHIWGDRPPRAANPVAPLASRLRRLIASVGDGSPGPVRFVSGGYRIDCEPRLIDVHRARAEVAGARAAITARAPERAVELFGRALAGWQPAALTGLGGDWAERTRAQLADERTGLLLEKAAAELLLGRHHEVLDGIRQQVAEQPSNEALVGMQMRALTGAGRAAEALHLYSRTRRVLADDLGVDPSPVLSALNVQILQNDPAAVRP